MSWCELVYVFVVRCSQIVKWRIELNQPITPPLFSFFFIRSDTIAGTHILVDINGHTKGSRAGVLALRPAPIQINWLGLAAPSGGGYIDYTITDRVLTPESQRDQACLSLVRCRMWVAADPSTRTPSPSHANETTLPPLSCGNNHPVPSRCRRSSRRT